MAEAVCNAVGTDGQWDGSIEANCEQCIVALKGEEGEESFKAFVTMRLEGQAEDEIPEFTEWAEFELVAEGLQLDLPAMRVFVEDKIKVHKANCKMYFA